MVGDVDLLIGADPIYVGLHGHEDTGDGRSYRDTAHVVHAFGQTTLPRARRKTTVVMPEVLEPWAVVHELGHVLDEQLGWQYEAQPVTAYAMTNRQEAFAEAFTAWRCPDVYWNVQDYLAADQETLSFFTELAA